MLHVNSVWFVALCSPDGQVLGFGLIDTLCSWFRHWHWQPNGGFNGLQYV